jgi:hypothetical protein
VPSLELGGEGRKEACPSHEYQSMYESSSMRDKSTSSTKDVRASTASSGMRDVRRHASPTGADRAGGRGGGHGSHGQRKGDADSSELGGGQGGSGTGREIGDRVGMGGGGSTGKGDDYTVFPRRKVGRLSRVPGER